MKIKKNFFLADNYDIRKGQGAIDSLNRTLADSGVHFCVAKQSNKPQKYKLCVEVDEQKLKQATRRSGRPVTHEFDYNKVLRMKAYGMTNKQIYESLGISKSLFYLKMRQNKS